MSDAHLHADGEVCLGRACMSMVDLQITHIALMGAHGRALVARKRLDEFPTAEAFAASDAAAKDLGVVHERARHALLAYGFASGLLEPVGVLRNETGPGRANDSEPANPPEDGP